MREQNSADGAADMQTLLQRFEMPLLQYATRILGDSDRARDVVQETFVKLQNENRSELDHAPAKWLFTVCRNGALNICRKEKRMTYLDQELLETRESEQPAPYENSSKGSERVSPPNPRHPAAAAAGSAATQISKRPQLPGDQRNHEALGQQRRRAHSQRPENSAATLRAGVAGFPAVHTSNCLMKINLDDPNLTAFALGELSGAEKAEMEKAVAASPEAQEFVAETRELSLQLKSEYEAERSAPESLARTSSAWRSGSAWSSSRRLARGRAGDFRRARRGRDFDVSNEGWSLRTVGDRDKKANLPPRRTKFRIEID